MKTFAERSSRGRSRAGKRWACLLWGIAGGIVFAFVGLVLGSHYGGNHATDFEFNGVRGYEATGQIGAIVGFVAGTPLCVWLSCIVSRG